MFCGEEASAKLETKKHVKYRRVVREVSTIEFKQNVLSRADERIGKARAQNCEDSIAEVVKARAMAAIDMVAAEAKYHANCHAKFFVIHGKVKGRELQVGHFRKKWKNTIFIFILFCTEETNRGRGRPEDPTKISSFQKIFKYMVENDDCQYSLAELENIAGSDQSYCRKTLIQKLRSHPQIVVTELPGKRTIVNFKARADAILYDNW